MTSEVYTYPALTAAIAVNDAPKAIEFYEKVFGAKERYRLCNPVSGQIGHAELLFGEIVLMLSEEMPAWNKSPQTLEGTTVKLSLIVESADEVVAKALQSGATELRPVGDEFYGFRSGTIRDPFGHEWMIQHQIEDVSPEEMQIRWENMVKNCVNES